MTAASAPHSTPPSRPPLADRPLAPSETAAGAGAGAAAAGLLDAQALARLQELDPQGQSGLVRRVLTTYTSSLARLLQQMQTAREARDCAALRHAAHTLKSSSASVGALALSAACAALETHLRDTAHGGAEAALAVRLDALLAEGERILHGLQASA